MASIIFFEKPGCINNTMQKKRLRQAGHIVHPRTLLRDDWEREELLRYFGNLPVKDWFNPGAPAIKSGRVDPAALGQSEALDVMIEDPLLIRRPLMRVGDEYRCGFDTAAVKAWIGLDASTADEDLETCPNQKAAGACE